MPESIETAYFSCSVCRICRAVLLRRPAYGFSLREKPPSRPASALSLRPCGQPGGDGLCRLTHVFSSFCFFHSSNSFCPSSLSKNCWIVGSRQRAIGIRASFGITVLLSSILSGFKIMMKLSNILSAKSKKLLHNYCF